MRGGRDLGPTVGYLSENSGLVILLLHSRRQLLVVLKDCLVTGGERREEILSVTFLCALRTFKDHYYIAILGKVSKYKI